jgi:hypothetical protein
MIPESRCNLQFSHKSIILSYHERSFLNIYFIIIFTSMLKSIMLTFPYEFSDYNVVCISHLPISEIYPVYPILINSLTVTAIHGRRVQIMKLPSDYIMFSIHLVFPTSKDQIFLSANTTEPRSSQNPCPPFLLTRVPPPLPVHLCDQLPRTLPL